MKKRDLVNATLAQAMIADAKESAPKAYMRSSAESCIDDALKCLGRGDYNLAQQWALRSMQYSMGLFSSKYQSYARTLTAGGNFLEALDAADDPGPEDGWDSFEPNTYGGT